MTESTRVELVVLGEKMTIRTVETPEYLQTLARFLEERVQPFSAGNRPPMTALILAALDIADELFRVRDEKSRTDGHVDARLRTLVAELERATPFEVGGAWTPPNPPGA
jgi:cell division protein ZapA (FtsZ GTPase activity inhibitor)